MSLIEKYQAAVRERQKLERQNTEMVLKQNQLQADLREAREAEREALRDFTLSVEGDE